ncbi:hypothetical protein Lfu02_17790 [Longispora fulva]|uniref:Uncharacterized protein n=1 Tax=Longispora fulva TaxID=619741 RepID=A0A8J7GL58_9ACTN|nr:hypothetical protein [Longispora fulva]MBG6140216.1 hypothetical protein [Longispora fulva]GIG57407.1 hypothetical protein Lfu02_17790 [Longispora fulva]
MLVAAGAAAGAGLEGFDSPPCFGAAAGVEGDDAEELPRESVR